MKKIFFKTILCLVFVIFAVTSLKVFAQAPDGGDDGGPAFVPLQGAATCDSICDAAKNFVAAHPDLSLSTTCGTIGCTVSCSNGESITFNRPDPNASSYSCDDVGATCDSSANQNSCCSATCKNNVCANRVYPTSPPPTPVVCGASCGWHFDPGDKLLGGGGNYFVGCGTSGECSECSISESTSSSGTGVCQPPTQPSPTPKIPACGTTCSSSIDCSGAPSGCTSCNSSGHGFGKVCGPAVTPTPTLTPACGVACSKPSDCAGSKDACTTCGSGGVCVPPVPSPTPKVPACGASCNLASDCAGTKDSCTACTNHVCSIPASPTPVPACGVVCSKDSDCAGSKDACRICNPTTHVCSVPNTPTPTPIPFNPAVCHCDGIDYSSLVSGQSVTITAHAKVEGADTSTAKIADQSFYLYEGAEVDTTRIGSSGPLPASVVSSTAGLDKYDSKWTFTLPTLKDGATYRIQAVPDCQPKTTAMNYIPNVTQATAVLGTSTSQKTGLFASIYNFFASILGIAPKSSTIASNSPSQPKSVSVNTESDVQPTTAASLQLTTFQPIEVYQKTCTFIKFKYQTL